VSAELKMGAVHFSAPRQNIFTDRDGKLMFIVLLLKNRHSEPVLTLAWESPSN